MCGRIVQKSDPLDYVELLQWRIAQSVLDLADFRYNMSPGSRPFAMHLLSGEPAIERMYWGYSPSWYKRGAVGNAAIEAILDAKKSFWRFPMSFGRMIVPADGWYEWTVDDAGKAPWFIHSADGKPLMMAAISGWRIGAKPNKYHGMAIVTDDAAGGMINRQERRPVVLTPDAAQEWADPTTPLCRAKEIMAAGRAESSCAWYRVTRRMNHSLYQHADSIEPI